MNAFVECSLYACFHAKYNLHIIEIPIVILFYKDFIIIFDIKWDREWIESRQCEKDNISRQWEKDNISREYLLENIKYK